MIEKSIVREPQVFENGQEGALTTPQPKGMRMNLATLKGARLAMAQAIRAEARGELETARAVNRVWMLLQLCDVLTMYELEKRIQDFEAERALLASS